MSDDSIQPGGSEIGGPSTDGTDHIYVVRAPHRSWWSDDYETAYQLATGTASERGGDDHEREEDIRVMYAETDHPG